MEDFLKGYFANQSFQSEKLLGDGGHRSYTRLITKNKDSYILMSSGEEDQSLKDFVLVQERLKEVGCFVPKIFQKDFSKGLLLMEDLGNKSLEEIKNKKGYKKSYPYYLKALKQLVHLQQVKLKSTNTIFDKKFFLKEIDVAINRLEEFLKITLQKESFLKGNLKESMKEEMKEIISEFVKSPLTYCHRDFHSKNIMIHQGEVYLLDFQDAGVGPWMYDLTSLLYDSYITFTDLEIQNLIKFYFENVSSDFQKSIGQFTDLKLLIQLQFLQRGFKACGCFASFYNDNQKTTHLKYIKPTLKNLYKVAKNLNHKNTASYFKELDHQINLKSFGEISNQRDSFVK